MAKYRYQGKITKVRIYTQYSKNEEILSGILLLNNYRYIPLFLPLEKVTVYLYVDNSQLREINGKRYLCLPNLEFSSKENMEAKCFEIEDSLLELFMYKSEFEKISTLLQKSSSVIVEFDDKKNITSIEFFLD